jgi:hypothetical protein
VLVRRQMLVVLLRLQLVKMLSCLSWCHSSTCLEATTAI